MAGWFGSFEELKAKAEEMKIKDKKELIEKCIEGQPLDIKEFMRNFTSEDKQELALYNYMIGTGQIIDVDLAQIADAKLLNSMWHNKNWNKEYSVRRAMVENPRCPINIIESAIYDLDWEVRRAAIRRPELSIEKCIEAARREGNLNVIPDLKERLGDMYPPEPEPPKYLSVGLAKTLDANGDIVLKEVVMNPEAESKPRLDERIMRTSEVEQIQSAPSKNKMQSLSK